VITRHRRADILTAAALAAATAIIWCLVFDRLTIRNWRVPLHAGSDALTVLALEKSAAEGDFLPLLPKFNPHLGAPYSANWNDFPVTNEPLIVAAGLLSKLVGLFAAANALVLLAQVLAAVTFYAVCRVLRYGWQWSAAGSLAFALSPYAFQRGLAHVNLTHYWYLPLCLLVCWWCGARGGLELRSRRFWVALGTALVTGVNNPYYTNVFLQFLGFAALAQILRRSSWRTIAAPIVLGLACLGAFLAMNVDTLYYQAVHGKNPAAASRTYQALEIYALKPLDLFIPPPDHRLPAARAIALGYIYDEARKPYVLGEGFSQYLGLAGLASLLWLGLVSVSRVLGPVPRPMPAEALAVVWLILYSVVGGLNGFLGQAGLTLFRCTNRYSIFILALALLFGVRGLTRLTSSWRPGFATLGMLVLAVAIAWDQLPPRMSKAYIAGIEARVASDRAFTAAMEKALPPSAMVFQLPVMSYPESWPIVKMADYEHLRPYLYSSSLHFSYGSDKGRARDGWQLPTSRLPVPDMVATLERAGFSAVYINRQGYADGGAALLAGLQAAGRTETIESSAGDLVCVRLHAASTPELPDSPPEFAAGWYDEESDATGDVWRYSSGNAELVLSNVASNPQHRRLRFELASPSPRTVTISVESGVLYRSPELGGERLAVSLPLLLAPGTTRLAFTTEPPIRFPYSPDQRLLGFLLYNLKLESDEGRR
jgi:phosphoglycerol transferase